MFLFSIASLLCKSLGVSRRRFFRTPWYQELVCALVEGFYFVFVSSKNLSKKLLHLGIGSWFVLWWKDFTLFAPKIFQKSFKTAKFLQFPFPGKEPGLWLLFVLLFLCLLLSSPSSSSSSLPWWLVSGHTCAYLLVFVLIMNLIGVILVIIMILDIAMMACHSCVCLPLSSSWSSSSPSLSSSWSSSSPSLLSSWSLTLPWWFVTPVFVGQLLDPRISFGRRPTNKTTNCIFLWCCNRNIWFYTGRTSTNNTFCIFKKKWKWNFGGLAGQEVVCSTEHCPGLQLLFLCNGTSESG